VALRHEPIEGRSPEPDKQNVPPKAESGASFFQKSKGLLNYKSTYNKGFSAEKSKRIVFPQKP